MGTSAGEEDDSEDESNASLDSRGFKQKLRVSAPLADLIRQCWQDDAELRPTFNQVLQSLNKEKALYSQIEENLSGNSDELIEDNKKGNSIN